MVQVIVQGRQGVPGPQGVPVHQEDGDIGPTVNRYTADTSAADVTATISDSNPWVVFVSNVDGLNDIHITTTTDVAICTVAPDEVWLVFYAGQWISSQVSV